MSPGSLVLAGALLLTWDQPYPPAGSPPDAQPAGVRCYVRAWGSVDWSLASTTGTVPPCSGASWGTLGLSEWVARGFNTAGESGDSNLVRVCTGESAYEDLCIGPPVPGATGYCPSSDAFRVCACLVRGLVFGVDCAPVTP